MFLIFTCLYVFEESYVYVCPVQIVATSSLLNIYIINPVYINNLSTSLSSCDSQVKEN